MWVYGFFTHAPRLAWALAAPDCQDLVFARAGLRHHRKRRLRLDINALVEAELMDIRVPGYGQWLFKLAGFAQRAGWYFLVIDATTDFLVNWTSTVYQYAGCQVGNARWMKAFSDGQIAVPTPAPQRVLFGAVVEGDGHLLEPGGTGVLQPAGMPAVVSYELKIAPWSFTGPPVGTISAEIRTSTGKTYPGPQSIEVDATGHATAGGFFRTASPLVAEVSYQLWFTCTGGFADLSGSSITIQADVGKQGILPGNDICGYSIPRI